ncbi:hypothetical protein Pelo_11801 [Pelomyxa schiedti]|nr:hypothetical protein Pelo_11801 [Pelomyxa schiedti]
MNEHGLKSVFCFLSATQDILSASRVSHLWRRVAIESGVFPYVPCCFLPAPWWSSRLNSVISSGERCDSDCGSDNDNGAKSAHVCCYSLAGLDDDSKREWYFGRQHAGLTVLRGLGLNELIPEQMRPFRILSIGLANAGKTVGTRLLKFHKILRTTYPTYDLLVEPLTWNYEGHNFKLEIWEIPGSDGESTWRHYASQCQGIMFTVDSSDFSSLKSAKWALHANFAESPKVLPLLVFGSFFFPSALLLTMHSLETGHSRLPYHSRDGSGHGYARNSMFCVAGARLFQNGGYFDASGHDSRCFLASKADDSHAPKS